MYIFEMIDFKNCYHFFFFFFFLHSWFSTLSYQQPVEDLTGVTVFTKTRTINNTGSHLAPNTS